MVTRFIVYVTSSLWGSLFSFGDGRNLGHCFRRSEKYFQKNTYRKEDSDSQTLLVIDPSARCGFVCPKIFMPHIFLNCSILNISGFKHVHSINKKLKIPKISLLRRPF